MTEQALLKVYSSKAMINFEGKDFLGQIGIDSRIFTALNKAGVSIGVISQQAIENGISVLVDEDMADVAVQSLKKEFEQEIKKNIVTQIYSLEQIAVVSLVSHNFDKILTELQQNKIFPLLLNQVVPSGKIDIVVASNQVEKTKNIIETELLGKPKIVHLVLLENNNIGQVLIEKIHRNKEDLLRRKRIELKIIAIANTEKIAIDKAGLGIDRGDYAKDIDSQFLDLHQYVQSHQLENLILVDTTHSEEIAEHYIDFVEHGFDIVSSNQASNLQPTAAYQKFRDILEKHKKKFLYETQINAGFPLMDTIKLLLLSGEEIIKIKAVFSSLVNCILNRCLSENKPLSIIAKELLAV